MAIECREMANILNSQFASVSVCEAMNNLPNLVSSFNGDEAFTHVVFYQTEIEIRLAKLDPAVDGIHPFVLRACASHFAQPLTLIITSFSQLFLSQLWRRANITPIFKKGSRIDSKNYRPISLTSVLCKEMEAIVYNSILIHLRVINLLVPQQYGFVSQKACGTNLMSDLTNISITHVSYTKMT